MTATAPSIITEFGALTARRALRSMAGPSAFHAQDLAGRILDVEEKQVKKCKKKAVKPAEKHVKRKLVAEGRRRI